MHSTKAWADVEYGWGQERISLEISVTFELAPQRAKSEQWMHGQNTVAHEAHARAHVREGGGHLGMGALGNKMLFQFDWCEREARNKALEALGIRKFSRAHTMEEFEAARQRFEGLQGRHVHVVLDY